MPLFALAVFYAGLFFIMGEQKPCWYPGRRCLGLALKEFFLSASKLLIELPAQHSKRA